MAGRPTVANSVGRGAEWLVPFLVAVLALVCVIVFAEGYFEDGGNRDIEVTFKSQTWRIDPTQTASLPAMPLGRATGHTPK